MTNFLKNLAKRSAGIPLATEYFPRASPPLADDFGSGAELDENALEDAANLSPNTPLASSPSRAINLASTSINQNQPVPDSAGRPKQESITPINSSSDHASPNSVTHVKARPDAGPGPKGKTLDMQSSFQSQDRDVDERIETGVLQTMTVRNETTHLQSNLRPLLSTRDAQTFVPPQVFAEPTEEQTPRTQEVSPPDQTIRPAPRDRPISLQFPKVADALPRTPSPLPIHVRVGRIEVRGNAAQQTSNVMSKQPAPLGFAAYQRLRRYRI